MSLPDTKITKKNVIPILFFGFFGFLCLFLLIGSSFFLAENLPSPPAQVSETQSTPRSQTTSEKITPEKLQQAVEGMADFMAKDGNRIGLRIWAKSLGRNVDKDIGADSLYATIRQASKDFSIYRDSQKVIELISLLSNYDIIFNEVLLQQLEETSQ